MVEEIYKIFYKDLLHYCSALAGNRAGAEDLVQDTYLRAMSHLEDLEGMSRSQLRSWLCRTAKNLYIDQVRKQSREVMGGDEPLLAAPFEEDFSGAAVAQLISRLPDGERQLFSMRTFEGYNAAELGELFHLKPSTVRSRLASARRRLIQYCQELT